MPPCVLYAAFTVLFFCDSACATVAIKKTMPNCIHYVGCSFSEAIYNNDWLDRNRRAVLQYSSLPQLCHFTSKSRFCLLLSQNEQVAQPSQRDRAAGSLSGHNFLLFCHNHAFVRETDGRTDSCLVARPRCMQCMRRGKKYKNVRNCNK